MLGKRPNRMCPPPQRANDTNAKARSDSARNRRSCTAMPQVKVTSARAGAMLNVDRSTLRLDSNGRRNRLQIYSSPIAALIRHATMRFFVR
jgi:hypothetical protein